MNDEYTIDPVIWFSDRELKFKPKHFVSAKSQLTLESKKWIMNNLRGRYALVAKESDDLVDLMGSEVIPSFEDPQEAVLYELTWSS